MGVILITFCLLQESSKSKELNVYLQLWGLTTKRTTLCLSLSRSCTVCLVDTKKYFPRTQSAPPRSRWRKKMFTASTQETIFSLRVLYLSSFIDAEGHHSNLFLLSALHIASPLLCCCGGGGSEKRRRRADPKQPRRALQLIIRSRLIFHIANPLRIGQHAYCWQRSFRKQWILTCVYVQFLAAPIS
jgi:hypothetical protein